MNDGFYQEQRQPVPSQNTNLIDPQNPFDNPLENREYRTDYRRTLPQILLPGFQIPLFPEREERRGIRKAMNAAGLGAFAGCLLSQILFTVLMLILLALMGCSLSEYFNGGEAVTYFENSTMFIALNTLVFTTLNVLVAGIGCRSQRITMDSLFQTSDFTVGKAFRYISIGMGISCIAGILMSVVNWIVEQNGSEMVDVDFSYFQNGKSILVTFLYTCILAPVTEELLYRGFLMKTLSKVSIRFGILISALLFGLMHGNLTQCVLGVMVGIYLGKIDTRHNSLLPSILVHGSINTFSMLLSLTEEVGTGVFGTALLSFLAILYYGIALTGVIFWFVTERKQPLPYPTQKQAVRSRTALTSPWLLVAIVFEFALMLMDEFAA